MGFLDLIHLGFLKRQLPEQLTKILETLEQSICILFALPSLCNNSAECLPPTRAPAIKIFIIICSNNLRSKNSRASAKIPPRLPRKAIKIISKSFLAVNKDARPARCVKYVAHRTVIRKTRSAFPKPHAPVTSSLFLRLSLLSPARKPLAQLRVSSSCPKRVA